VAPNASYPHTLTSEQDRMSEKRPTADNGHAKLRVLAGIAAMVALVALVGSAATRPVGAAELPQWVEQLASDRSGTDPHLDASSVGSARDQRPPTRLASSTSELEHVDLFGDSLGYEAEPYLDALFAHTHTYTMSDDTYGGTATCDWLSKMALAAAERPQVAILVFSGNAFTPCMDGATPRSPQYYDLYVTYTKQAIHIFSAVRAHVFLVGTPIDESSVAGWDRLDEIYRQLARANPLAVTFVDAGSSVETASGGFTWSLPCLSSEPVCGPDGTNLVRSPDGSHFCPDGTPARRGVVVPCDEYSSGAFRFALALMNAVTQYAYSTPGDK
jgi:hypothetical protein